MFKKECRLSDKQVEEKASQILEQMTLKEKVYLLNGNFTVLKNLILYRNVYNPVPIETNGCKRLGVTPVKFTDGPRGIVMGHSTCFPVSMARGASFDRELERKIGDAIGKEARAGGANYYAGVCINLLRHPAWGRAQETYGEDSFHVGEFGKVLTQSVQKHNVMACPKHYALNSIENSRFRVNVNCSERALREVYLPHFKKCIDAGAASIMGAYNKFRGDHACESDYLLNTILRDEWGFEGFTISDFLWGVRNTVKAIEAGLDIEMPMPIYYQKELLQKVKNGDVKEETLDLSALRVIKTILVFDNTPDEMTYTKKLVASKEHIELAREAAEKSMVLIKNEENVLPFSKDVKRVLVVGKLAAKANTGDFGSSRIYAPYVVTQIEGFRNYFDKDVEVVYYDESEIEKAKDEAKRSDCVVIIAGNDAKDEGECLTPDDKSDASTDIVMTGLKNQGNHISAALLRLQAKSDKMKNAMTDGEPAGGDRSNLSLKQNEIEMIKELGRINNNTCVALIGGSMIMTKEWDEHVPAIMYSWYSGMEGGNALPKILFGDVNPSGKLPFTIPMDEKDLPYFSSSDNEITYDLYHGYTKLDKDKKKAAYPFGFGLSYTRYEYQDLKVKENEEAIEINITVKNTGNMDGEEVVQVYVGHLNSEVERPKKTLTGFEKVSLKVGECKQVAIIVDPDELRYFDEASKSWKLENGSYRFYVGSSSDEKDLLQEDLLIEK
jgi:beta-glucosidase